MADARRFIYNSDYTTPAFVAKWEGSFQVAAYDYLDTSFDHNLPFTPLIVGQWSLNENFEPAYDIATSNGYFVGVNWNQVAGSNATKIKFYLNNGYNTEKTYYYRLFALAPSDYDGDIPSIEDSTNFRFNSDFNYPKLFAYGHTIITQAGDFVYNHNLGYIPQVRTWKYDSLNDVISPFVNVHYQDGSYTTGTVVDSTTMTIVDVLSGDEVYYHIYADEV